MWPFMHLTFVIIAALFRVHVGFQVSDTGQVDRRILIQDNYYSLVSKLEALTQKVDNLTAQNQNLQALTHQVDMLKAQNHNLSLMYEQLKTDTVKSKQEVAFYATLTTAVSGIGRYIHYDNIRLNIGNGYNPNHGVFVVPVSGTYLFSLYVCGQHTEAVLNLYVNNTVKGTMLAADRVYPDCNSEVFVLSVSAGDDVYVKTHANRNANIAVNTDYGLPSFTGVLLWAHA